MSNSVRPHRQQPTRLPRPWDSPGKNTGVGCHFLLQCMKVKSEREVAQLCPTLSDLMDCSLPGSSIHGIFQTRVLEWGAIATVFTWTLFLNKLFILEYFQIYRKVVKIIQSLYNAHPLSFIAAFCITMIYMSQERNQHCYRTIYYRPYGLSWWLRG